MNKSLLRNFFLIFLVFYVGALSFAIFSVKTGLSTKKSHITKNLEDPKYFATTFGGKQNTFLAAISPNKGRAKAADESLAWKLAGTIASYYLDPDESPSNSTFLKTTASSGGNLINEIATGCPTIDQYGKEIASQTPVEQSCYANSIPNKFEDQNFGDTVAYSPNVHKATLFGLASTTDYYAHKEQDTMTNLNLYAYDTLKQIPFIGAEKAQAASPFKPTTYPQIGLQSITFAEGFYNLWVYARNLSYYLIIIPTIAFGFAIMFRMQIGPQTQVTLMQAIPRLLIVILLITFSYPLVAFGVQLVKPITELGISLIMTLARNSLAGAQVVTGSGLAGLIGVAWLSSVTGLIGGLGFLALVAGVTGILFFLIVYLKYVFRVFYITLKLGFLISLGPIILLFGAFPGKEGIVKNYFINVGADILGLAAMSVGYAAFFAVIVFGKSLGLLPGIVLFFVACGLLWKTPSFPKQIAEAMGAESLLGGGGDKKPPRR
jgi:hypothetical protein